MSDKKNLAGYTAFCLKIFFKHRVITNNNSRQYIFYKEKINKKSEINKMSWNSNNLLKDGKTQAIYSLIRDGKYHEVIPILEEACHSHPRERAALSLLAYCYYFQQD